MSNVQMPILERTISKQKHQVKAGAPAIMGPAKDETRVSLPTCIIVLLMHLGRSDILSILTLYLCLSFLDSGSQCTREAGLEDDHIQDSAYQVDSGLPSR